MDITGVGSILDIGTEIIKRVWPNPEDQAKAQLELQKVVQAGEFKEIDARLAEMQAQTSINAVEAANANVFVSGWRPFVGWICGLGLGYEFLVRSMLNGLLGYERYMHLDINGLTTLLFGMLGLAGMRTYEKRTNSENRR
ncbi:Holin of 3TMs, for gene-transfer release [uncultured Caudovirales phage]|uniref:Holin of 3TMs, for gene-transfer release n=1 Tax=uncultured Caudovirales phage TaxID=2100421 RepID=A0A6J5T8T0_9CAUD|nr:Holin of 3TMs, for gene-transfer release [uncultured Caudovirales phage]